MRYAFIILAILGSLFLVQTGQTTAIFLEAYDQAPEKPDLLLYYSPWCPYCQRVLTYLKTIKKTLPMENLENNPTARADLEFIGGKPQIPCLIIDGEALYESQAIIEWLFEHQHLLDLR